MTRTEQIKQGIIEHYGELGFQSGMIRETFETAVKWADENPKEGLVSLDKVCEWLGNRDIMERILHCRTSLIDDYVKEFRKAMEE